MEQKLKLNVAKAETAATDAASLKVELANAEEAQKQTQSKYDQGQTILMDETLLRQRIVKRHSEETQACSKSFCCTFQLELTHRQATNTKNEELSSRVDVLSKLLEHKIQENKGLIAEKASSVSQLQGQHSIELEKLKK